MRNTLLVLHLIGVAIWLGGNVVLAFAGPRNNSAPTEARLWWAQTQGAMARVLYNVAGILVLVTGIGLVLESEAIEFSDTFVTIGFVAVIVGAVLGMAVFGPGSRKLTAAIESGDESTEKSLNSRLAVFGLLDTLVVVFTVAAMVGAWGLG
jgi:uncharacterized membrane protein SirB2